MEFNFASCEDKFYLIYQKDTKRTDVAFASNRTELLARFVEEIEIIREIEVSEELITMYNDAITKVNETVTKFDEEWMNEYAYEQANETIVEMFIKAFKASAINIH
ncbi:hypothetical protein [Peribacillus glennii]|uniref:Uncharacterized protein n=1 Tax=Peribacillus glennii TaxID=2303991 RepID=A0A372L6B3_9BACI|nr:hypothetical protein [Peribacillus glennii]RFU60524.1 hypothetical protein D0466_21100 [Peribacillus glennii]